MTKVISTCKAGHRIRLMVMTERLTWLLEHGGYCCACGGKATFQLDTVAS